MRNLKSLTGSLAAIGILLVSTCPSAMAKNSSGKKPQKAHKSWSAAVKVEGKGRYDSNPFLLSDRQKTKLQTAGPADQISGRFNDMNSVNDFIFTPSAKFLAEGPGFGGRKLGLEAGVNYDRYFRNPRRSHVNIELAAEQDTSRNGRARVKFEYTPSYFYKNYLADATNYTTSVLPSERVYKPDVYSEWDITVDYRYRLAGNRAALLGRAGYLRQRNQGPFVGHDRNEPHMGGGLDFGLTHWWKIDGNYDYALVDSPRVQEVMILNEPDFGVDFNNDGNTTDLSIRTVQFVDRRHHEQLFRASTKLGIRERSYVEFGYERRHRNFLSKEPFEVFHNGRTDNRNTFRVAFVSHFNERLQFSTGYNYIFENSNRPNDPGVVGEVNDYKRDGAFVGMSYRF
ncbi:MAG: hypothetical protein PVS2B2_00460 [Candidatus Acidiferrum sp.]